MARTNAPARRGRWRRVLASWTVATIAGTIGALAPLSASTPAVARPIEATAATCGLGVTRTDQLLDTPWPLRRLQPELAWPLSRGRGITVAVIDSGVSDDHPKLAGKVDAGTDLVEAGNGTCDDSAHGTFVAGIIAGRDTRDAPYTGVAPDARIVPVRVLRDTRQTTSPAAPANIAKAITWAVDRKVSVINLSLATAPTPDVAKAIAYARSKDVVLVAAAGNEGQTALNNEPLFPAAYAGVVAVAGVDANGQRVQTSSEGAYVDIAAPGLDIVGPAPRGKGYSRFENGGTSFAAAYVSGVAALIRGYFPKMAAPEVIRRLTDTADHPAEGWNRQVGYGVVNPYRAVAAVLADGPAPPADARPANAKEAAIPTEDGLGGGSGTAKAVAAWTAGIGAGLSGLVLLGAAATRRGRARRWRPGRLAPPGEPTP